MDSLTPSGDFQDYSQSTASNGFIAVDRALFGSDLWTGEKFTRGQAVVDLIQLAKFKPGHARIRGVRVDLERGQLAWSEAGLAKRWCWSVGKVRRFLSELKTARQITLQKNNVTTVITITNYSQRFKSGKAESLADETANGTANGSANGRRTNKETNKQIPPPTPSLSAASVVENAAWVEGVEEVLISLGMGVAQDVTKTARNNGNIITAVQAVIAYWKANLPAWDVGGLAWRLRRLRPGQRVDELWPDKSYEAEARAADERSEARRREQFIEEQERAAINDQHDHCIAELEESQGPRLDSLSKEQIIALTNEMSCDANTAKFLLQGWVRKGNPVPLPTSSHRQMLLKHLAAKLVEGNS